jgi:hypothetical protein
VGGPLTLIAGSKPKEKTVSLFIENSNVKESEIGKTT